MSRTPALSLNRHSTPLSGLAAARWYLYFFRDPIGCMRKAYHTFGQVSAMGEVLPRPRRRLHILGLTRMTGTLHQEQRRLVMPTLQRKAIENYVATAADIVERVVQKWQAGPAIDMWQEMKKLVLMQSSVLLFDRENTHQARALGQMIEQWLMRNFSVGVWLFPLNLPGTPYRALLKHAQRLEQKVLAMIEEKQKGNGTDILSLLTRAHREGSLDKASLVGQATVLFGASYETTKSALGWTLFLLAQHPKVMHQLLDELEGTLRGGLPTIDLLERMPLLEAVVKESMRILPPVPFTIRTAEKPCELGGFQVKRGDRAICSHYVTHHMPELYEEPERFRPERWSHINPDPYEYLPFSAGPRACIGYGFAMMAIKVSLAIILSRVRLTVLPGTRVDRTVRVTMSPRYGLPMSIHPQDRRFESVSVSGNIREMVDLS